MEKVAVGCTRPVAWEGWAAQIQQTVGWEDKAVSGSVDSVAAGCTRQVAREAAVGWAAAGLEGAGWAAAAKSAVAGWAEEGLEAVAKGLTPPASWQ